MLCVAAVHCVARREVCVLGLLLRAVGILSFANRLRGVNVTCGRGKVIQMKIDSKPDR